MNSYKNNAVKKRVAGLRSSKSSNNQTFRDRVYEAVKLIPRGKVKTYKEIAIIAGSPRAFRAVGNILNKNRNPLVPCHRVIHSDGSIGGFAFGSHKKEKILKKEGVEIKKGRLALK